jgi:rSAM/selenodomain-associated transferase 1
MEKSISKHTLLGIMAKYPLKGKVKTRLVPSLEPELAAGLYEAVMLDTINTLDRMYFEKAIFYHPPMHQAYFKDITGPEWQLFPQTGKDLGQRLTNAFLGVKNRGFPVVILGSDSPALMPEYIIEAILLLHEGNDISLGPAEDGGFYLIGIRDVSSTPVKKILNDVRWSSQFAMQDVVENINKAGKKVAYTPEWFDLDTEEDLKKTVEWFNMHDEKSFMNTRRFIFGNEIEKRYE